MKEIKNIRELEEAINAIDWQKLHKYRIHHDYGMSVWLYWDGEKVHMSLQTQGTVPGPHNVLFASFPCDVDATDYEEGWAEQLEDDPSKYRNLENKRIITEKEMIDQAIEEGDFSDAYEYWKDEIRDEWLNYQ